MMKSIQTKITITSLFWAVLIVAGISIIASIKVESYFKQQLVSDLAHQADLIHSALDRGSVRSFRELDDHVRNFAGAEQVRITLIDETGRVIADSDVPYEDLPSVDNHLNRPEVQEALRNTIGYETRHSATVGRDFLYVARLVENRPSAAAYGNVRFIRLSMPLEDVQTRIDEIRWDIFVAGILVLLVVAVVSIVVSRRIATPMVQIARSVQRIRTGNLDERIVVTSDDEIAHVAEAINELVDKLKSDIVQLTKLEQVRKEFLENVSHELRTPIFAIQGFLETLLNGAVDDPSVNRSFLEKAQANATRLNALLEDLINISQIESGEMKMSFRYFPIGEFLQSVAREIQPVASQNNVTLAVDLQTPNGTEVFGDKERLRQVLSNLIENGLKYNRKGGEVCLSTEEKDEVVRISVRDTGLGIPDEHVSRIFERFYRVDKDRSREVGGTGLGLAIVKHIIEAHGSTTEVESVVGKGTTFSFALKKA